MDDLDLLADRFCGTLLGAAVADSLALPWLHHSRRYLSSISGPIIGAYAGSTGLHATEGQYAARTQVMLALAEATIEHGESEPDAAPSTACALAHLLPLWRDQVLVESDPSCDEALRPLLGQPIPLRPGPLPEGRAEAAPICRAVVPGLWYHEKPEVMLARTDELVLLTHTDRRTRACAAGVAGAIAHLLVSDELLLGEFLDATASAAARHDQRVADIVLDVPRILSMSEGWCQRYFDKVYPAAEYPGDDDGLGAYCVPTFLFGLYYFLRHPGRFSTAVDDVIRLGGRMDTCAAVTGTLCGAFSGGDSLPSDLVDRLTGARELRRAALALRRSCPSGADSPAAADGPRDSHA